MLHSRLQAKSTSIWLYINM